MLDQATESDAGAAAPKTYTDADVSRIVNAAQERSQRKAEKEMADLREQLERKSETELADLREQLAAVKPDAKYTDEEVKHFLKAGVSHGKAKVDKEIAELRSDKEKADAELQSIAGKLKAVEGFAIRNMLKTAAIPKAAGKTPAATADIIADFLVSKAVYDHSTNAVSVEVEIVEGGAKVKRNVTPEQAVEWMSADVDKYGALFKGPYTALAADKNEGEHTFKDMPWKEFNELAEKHPEKVGLPRR